MFSCGLLFLTMAFLVVCSIAVMGMTNIVPRLNAQHGQECAIFPHPAFYPLSGQLLLCVVLPCWGCMNCA